MSEDPYTPPSSELQNNDEFKRSVWWKVYFFLITILSIPGTLTFVASENSGSPEFLSVLSLVISTVGLYGFCFLKQILFPRFWMGFLIVYFFFGIAYLFITEVDLRMGASDGEYYASLAFGYFISLPYYYALYSYGNARNPPWSK